MLEIHELPTAEVYSGTYSVLTNGEWSAGVSVAKLVMFDKRRKLENGVPGLTRFIQISSSILSTIPAHNSKIVINNISYEILDPIRRASPAFITFWEAEIKETNLV